MNTLRATGFVLENNILSILDQQLLPREERWVECSTVNDLVSCIQTLKVRGAPAIGIVAALFLGLLCESEISSEEFLLVSKQLRDSRPTAVNLGNYLDRLNSIAELSAPNWRPQIQTAAHHIFLEDVKLCEEIASHGVPLLRQNARILTHCNTGSIATAGRGTALGILTKAHEEGKEIHVWVDETRPLLQGARLTAWELQRAGIPHTILCDNMAGFLMQQGKVDCV
ncbi:MAG: S-methyl-5-thioribose-1-phosphate isomerase, partial [Bdellovibrionales bacterium]|nr:S-methyl-5-thioribose-1-phosphate isomerase [Bdellovibrionales bacterium]